MAEKIRPGDVIDAAFRFHEEDQGMCGRKYRKCVVLSVLTDENGKENYAVVPMTSSDPRGKYTIPVDAEIKRNVVGLYWDKDSNIVPGEINIIGQPSEFMRMNAQAGENENRFVFGRIPDEKFAQIYQASTQLAKLGRAHIHKVPPIEDIESHRASYQTRSPQDRAARAVVQRARALAYERFKLRQAESPSAVRIRSAPTPKTRPESLGQR